MQKSHKIVDRALDLHLGEQKRKSAIRWSALNVILLSILTFDIYSTALYYDLLFYYIEMIACIILSISLIKNILTYLYYTFFVDQVVCENEDQRILLNLSSSNSMVKTTKSTLETVKKQDTNDTVWGSVKNLSWQSWGDRKCYFISFPEFLIISHSLFSELSEFERSHELDVKQQQPVKSKFDSSSIR